jgi:hypothetical protein
MYQKPGGFIATAGLLSLLFAAQLAFAHGMSEADKLAIIEGGNLRYMWLGATHMLSGYDHLLFVFGVIFFLNSFREIAKYVTAFTIGHSVTLIYATFNAIQLNYFLIDAVIALSVCYIAFANIDGFRRYLGINPPNMLMMISAFGLIHGFGLSTQLQRLPLSEEGLLLNIISFNIGIELGQIAALVLMLLLIAAWRKRRSFQPFSLAANYCLVIAGGLLFIMQMHGYAHTANPEEFGASAPAALSSPAAVAAPVEPVEIKGSTDTISLTISPRSGKEFKLHLANGASFAYEWKTDGAQLFYDFHGEPTGDNSGYFESFAKGTSNEAAGELTASFDGTHGWYWKNNASSPVVIELRVRGAYRLPEQTDRQPASPPVPASPPSKRHDSID